MAESSPRPASTLTVRRSKKSGRERAICCLRVFVAEEDDIGQVVGEQHHEDREYHEQNSGRIWTAASTTRMTSPKANDTNLSTSSALTSRFPGRPADSILRSSLRIRSRG
jgi:hypothetical protein